MNDIFQSISNREWASLFWLVILAITLVLYKPMREPLGSVLKAFLQPIILIPLMFAALYAAGEIYLLKTLDWWSIANLKTTILWLITFAFVAMFEIVSIRDHKTGLRKITRDIVTVTSFFVFITELHSFSLPVEIIALPIVTFIALLTAVAELKPEHAPVSKFLGCILGLSGLGYLAFSLWITYEEWQKTTTWATGSEFLVPILLSLGFLPFLYGWRLYVIYSETFTTLGIVGIDKKMIPYARWLAATRIRGDLEMLERWRKTLISDRPETKAELRHSLTALQALKAREASPPTVQPNEGWSPYFAMQFMSDMGYNTGHYHNSFDDEWFASSPMREFGDGPIWKNNVAYYIEGSEHSATTLKLKLNINDPENARPTEEMFVVHALHLLEQAVSLDAVERMKAQVAKLEPFSSEIPYGSVSLSRDDFVGGIEDGYSRKFEVIRGCS